MTRLSLRNPLASLMLGIGTLIFALVVTPRMPIDTFPDLTPPVLVVGTLAPGLAAKDVEKTLTWRIEKYVSATPGVEHVQSESRNNLSIAYVWLAWGTDLNAAQTLVQQQVQFAMSAVPKSLGVIPPFVLQFDPTNAPVVQVTVSGGGLTGPQLYDYALNNIEPLLEGIPGVASASPNGGRQRQINVIVRRAEAQSRGVTAEDVATAVAKSNALLPSGEFIAPTFDANVYTDAVPKHVKQIGEAMVKLVDGHPVYISDVAQVEDGGAAPTQAVSVNGQNAVYLNVLRIPGGNTLKIVDQVKKIVAGLPNLPPGMVVKPVFDESTFVKTSYSGLKREVVQALILISLVILIFLQSFRGTLIVAIAIPLAFAITLIVLYATGQTLNSFTLGGLTLAMGPLVDGAVVVLESIHRHHRQGLSLYRAALEGTNAVALPVLASTLCTIAVLLPVLLLAGLAKKLFAPLALTVAVAMIASYVISMFVTPVACRYFLGTKEPRGLGRRVGQATSRLADGYARLLGRMLAVRGWVVAACLVLTLGGGLVAARLPSAFFPEIDESMERVYVRFSPGISLDEAAHRVRAMAKMLHDELPKGEVELVLTNQGSPENARSAMTSPNDGPHMGFIRVALVEPEHRKHSQQQIADQMRRLLEARYPGVEFLQWPGGLVASVFSNGYVAPIAIEVQNDDLTVLEEQAQAIAAVARSVGGVRDIRVQLQTTYPEIHVDTVRSQAGFVDVTARQAAQATLDATLGNINAPSVWIDPHNGQAYYVVTYYDERDVPDTGALGQLPVRVTPDAKPIALGAYANITRAGGPIAIERDHMKRVTEVYMQTEGRDVGSIAAELDRKLAADSRTSQVKWAYVGEMQLMRTTFGGLGVAMALAVMVVFIVMTIQFKSLRLPFVMLFAIPVCLVGITIALLAAGQGFSVTALMGVLMVIGIAVSNGILLVSEASVHLNRGATKVDAVVAAARTRFIPIMMTSLATIIGLTPTALGLEAGTEANQALALAVVGGLTSSTLLSLFLVPSIFTFLAKPIGPAEDDSPPPSSPASPGVTAPGSPDRIGSAAR
ncbi:MAG TPA: efflux RND transporter permease subunit [Polyangia bacterium]|nr:efflux RND transporter permease subunit [Polyangia bacterium]